MKKIIIGILFLLLIITSVLADNIKNAEGYIKQAETKLGKQDYSGAIKDCNAALELAPKNLDAYCIRGNAEAALKDFGKATKDCNKAIELDPQYARSYRVRGYIKFALKNYKEAVEDYTTAIALDPTNIKGYVGRYNNKAALKDYEGVIKDCNKAIELDPKYVEAYYFRGNAKFDLNDYDGAIKDYTKLTELVPKLAEPYALRGTSKAALKNLKGALRDFDKAIELDPNDAIAYGQRGLVKYAVGDKQGALEDVSTARKLGNSKAYWAIKDIQRKELARALSPILLPIGIITVCVILAIFSFYFISKTITSRNTIKVITEKINKSLIDKIIKDNNLLDINGDFKQKIEEQILAVHSKEELSEAAARKILEKWYQGIKLRRKDISFSGSDISLQIDNNVALYIQIKYQIENRSAKEVTTNSIDDQLIGKKLEGIWEKPLNEVENSNTDQTLKNGKYKWDRKGSGKSYTCPECSGSGSVLGTCLTCWGSGQITIKDKVIVVGSTFKNAAENAGGAVGYVERKETCPDCQGNGKVIKTCRKCKGTGAMFSYETIGLIASIEAKNIFFIPDKKIKTAWFTQADDKYVVKYNGAISKPKMVDTKKTEEIKYTHEEYNVKAIPVAKVKIQFGKETDDILIVNGTPKTISILRFIDKIKLSAMIASSAIIVICLCLGAHYLL